ncbi:MAG TPA: hypothetical protein VGN34_08835, partial [Ktedonobacteraceae bacterium]
TKKQQMLATTIFISSSFSTQGPMMRKDTLHPLTFSSALLMLKTLALCSLDAVDIPQNVSELSH